MSISSCSRCFALPTLLLTLVSCTGDGSLDPAGSGLPTHTETEVEQAGWPGVLAGEPDCLWLDTAPPRALVLPAGSTTRQAGDVVILVGPDGQEVARTGDEVLVGGGASSAATSCLDDAEAADPIIAGSVEVESD